MSKDFVIGRVVKGYRVASGISQNSPYPSGSISMQLPFFRKLGLNLYGLYPATLNISIFPEKFALINPEYTFRDVKWSENHPAEDFSFSRCELIYKNKIYDGFIYYPHPETKPAHYHDESSIEIICSYIKNLYYGAPILCRLSVDMFRI